MELKTFTLLVILKLLFFKVVYRRHTNFACEAIEQTFNGTPALGGRATVPITRNGDLVTKMWLKTTVKTSDTLVKASKSDTAYQYIIEGTPTVNALAHANGKTIKVEGTAANRITVTVLQGFAAGDFTLTVAAGDIIKLEGFTQAGYNGSFAVQAVTTAFNAGTADGVYVCHAPGMTVTGAETSDAATHKISVFDKSANDEYETFEWGTDLGYSLINSVELQIGGTKIDKHYGRWMHVWSQLTRNGDHDKSHTEMIACETAAGAAPSHELYVPLQFFCCRNDGLALPLIALQYHDVRLEFEFQTGQNTVVNLEADGTVGSKGGNVSMSNTTLLVNYIYLDSEERKRFAQASHEYLIEQLQFTGVETVVASGSNKIRLNFNHPVKELVWAAEKYAANISHFDFSNGSSANPVSNALLQLNGHDRFAQETGKFFNYVQPHTHHSRTPAAGINVYSFALNPEEHQPSGTCNFSRIDNATLNVTTAAAGTQLYVYGVNYNVLRIMSGMGGVAYSN
jgi:hypothetical protein